MLVKNRLLCRRKHNGNIYGLCALYRSLFSFPFIQRVFFFFFVFNRKSIERVRKSRRRREIPRRYCSRVIGVLTNGVSPRIVLSNSGQIIYDTYFFTSEVDKIPSGFSKALFSNLFLTTFVTHNLSYRNFSSAKMNTVLRESGTVDKLPNDRHRRISVRYLEVD